MNNSVIPENGKTKDFTLTFIQVISALAVVTLHTNGCFWQFSATERYWFTANIIECLCYFAVPVFFMITGITLLDYQDRYSTKGYFKKRFEKTLLPYVAWSLIGVLFLLITKRITPETVTAKWVVSGLLSADKIIDLYWFFRPLFCVYLCIPLFASIDKRKKIGTGVYLLIAGFIINTLLPFFSSLFHVGLEWPFRIDVISGYLFWIWGGYTVYKAPPTEKQKKAIYVLSLIGLLMHIVGTYTLSVSAGSIQRSFKGYNNVPCIFYTFGVFVFLKDVAEQIKNIRWLKELIQTLGKYTFPVYLIHWFVLRVLQDMVGLNTKSITYRLMMPYVIYLVILIIAWLLRKIPVLRRIVP